MVPRGVGGERVVFAIVFGFYNDDVAALKLEKKTTTFEKVWKEIFLDFSF